MQPTPSILDVIADPALFGTWFRKPETWQAWFAFLTALFGLPMTDEQVAIYRRHTARETQPSAAALEAWLVVGRRGGKSFIMALVAVFLACFRDYRPWLQPGERATVMVIAADRRQARVILRYVAGMLGGILLLKAMIERETADGFDLTNSVTIEVGTASFRTTRGYTFAAVLADEIAFWRTDDSANPDSEILAAIRPGLATIPGAMLIAASSPYAKRGELWNAFKRFWGKDGAALVWKATTREMNPVFRQSVVDDALERDPASAASEYLAEFRSDIETFVAREVVEAATVDGRFELAPLPGVRYSAFTDPSGGTSDSFTLSIVHQNKDGMVILDAARDRQPPFAPDAVTKDFAELLKVYGLREVTGDRYAGEWPRERFRAHGIEYKLAEKPKSDIYRDLLPMLNSARVELLDLPRLGAQLCALERRTSRGGRDSIDHPPGAHDDLANAVAGAIVHSASNAQPFIISDALLARSRQPTRFAQHH